MPRLTALLLAPFLFLAAPAAQAGQVFFEGLVIQNNGVELRIGNNRHVPHWNNHQTHGYRPYLEQRSHVRDYYPHIQQRGYGPPLYERRVAREAWRDGFDAGRRFDDGPRWHGGWNR